MMQQIWSVVWLAAYFAVFTAALLGIAKYYIARQRLRPPLEIKFLRGPGESLRQRLDKFDDDLVTVLPAATLVPVVAGLATFGIIIWLNPHMRLTHALSIIAGITLLVMFFSGRWFLRKFFRYRNDRLGYLGERAVGEALVELYAAGYRVFHDIPAEIKGRKFNVDHVAVGTGGVFAIETKTRRKGRARVGFEDFKVAYDGRQLIWPWTEDDFGLQAAQDRAVWLSGWINKMTGLGIAAQPVLALPGWYVVPKGVGPVMVVNHKQLPTAILRAPRGVLTGEQVDLIARQLDDRCRDVDE